MAIKIIHVILLASVKYIFTLPYAMIIGLEYKQAIIAVLIGGIGGFLFFYYISKPLLLGFNFAWPCICNMFPAVIKKKIRCILWETDTKTRSKSFFKKKQVYCKNKINLWLVGNCFCHSGFTYYSGGGISCK